MDLSRSLYARRVRLLITAAILISGGLALFKPQATLRAADNVTRRIYAPIVFHTPAPQPARELLAFDWNGPITLEHHGIPAPDPLPGANGDWTRPINFAQGTIYMRIEVRSQPRPQDMRLQICWWQDGREACTRAWPIRGERGAVVTWSQSIPKLWALNEQPIDWTRPRANGIVIKDADGDMVSDYGDWNWGGHNPNEWFPLDVRFTAIVVEKGASFSGWQNYAP